MMLHKRFAQVLLYSGLAALAVAGCVPVRPITRDGLGNELPINNAVVAAVEPLGYPGVFTAAWDAALSPDAQTVYFVGSGPQGPGVFQVPGDGGDVTVLAAGEPLADPTGVAVSLDGAMVYVADGKAVLGQGAVLAVDPADGTVAVVAGSQGTAARGLSTAKVGDTEYIYFVGARSEDGAPAVYRIAAGGGQAELLAAGAPLVEPVGVTATSDGTVYVVDRLAGGGGLAAVFRIAGGEITTVATGLRTGERVAGAALTGDEQVLLVSAMAPDRPSAQVLGIVLGSGDKFVVTKEVEQHPGSGGVHRAAGSNTFVWADSGGGVRPPRCSPCVMRIDTP
jgi:DNA-binding beta-propeller fold protein YncE